MGKAGAGPGLTQVSFQRFSVYNTVQLIKLDPDLNFLRANYNWTIAKWLKHCRETHNEICRCGNFRSHWHQTPAIHDRSVQTQTPTCPSPSSSRGKRPLVKERKVTWADVPGVTPPTRILDPAGPSGTWASPSGQHLIGHVGALSAQGHVSGLRNARKRLEFGTERLPRSGSRSAAGKRRTRRPLTQKRLTSTPNWPTDTSESWGDSTEEDGDGIEDTDAGMDSSADDMLPEGAALAESLTAGRGASAEPSSTPILARMLYGEPAPTTS